MQVKRIFIAAFLGIICLLPACKKNHRDITRSFYYWKTMYRPSAYELSRLHQLSVNKMYLRFFDVDWDHNAELPVPIAPIQLPLVMDTSFTYVPVVFITAAMTTALKKSDIPRLANNIAYTISDMCDKAGIKPKEIQIDCDWAAGTRDAYFSLLHALRQQQFIKVKLLSCTLRMHQVKYTVSSGIPPVDRAMLMCYSMGDIKKPGERNSILDAEVAKDYLRRIKGYSLPLDIALPLFEWSILFHDQKFHGILRDVPTAEVKKSGLFKLSSGNLYTCLQDTVWHGYLLSKNDMVRLDAPTPGDILSIAEFTSQQVINKSLSVSLFACDSITLSKYSRDELEAFYNSYR